MKSHNGAPVHVEKPILRGLNLSLDQIIDLVREFKDVLGSLIWSLRQLVDVFLKNVSDYLLLHLKRVEKIARTFALAPNFSSFATREVL